ncbi:MAG: amino acid decarboxylase, partial [Gemmatimonadales bacterium]
MGSGDVPGPELREWLAAASDRVVDYLDEVEDLPVASRTRKGDLVRMLGTSMREEGVSAGELLREFDEAILPAVTHWNHPSFHGYFAITSSGPGIVAELLAAGLNLNAMTWQASPAGTELEWVVTRQLAHLLGLPEGFAGAIHDTASVSTLTALAGARSRAWPDLDRDGMFGMAPGRIYTSEESHSSVEKAARVLGFGRAGVRRIPVDDAFRMRPDALARALREDGEAGIRPVAVVATLGTTSTTSMDPVVELLGPVREAGAWLHVDAAYGGPLAALPEFRPHFTGWEEADSIVVNPHKWLFTPVDCSVLWTRDPDELRAALSAVPEYLRDRSGGAGLEGDLGEATSDLMDTGIALGRRFRSLKLR